MRVGAIITLVAMVFVLGVIVGATILLAKAKGSDAIDCIEQESCPYYESIEYHAKVIRI